MKTALITGITGQDGGYLAKFLLGKGYNVVGLTRNNSILNTSGLRYLGINDKVHVEECDLCDLAFVIRIIEKFHPQEIYNLAAQSSVGLSFMQPTATIQYNINSVLNLLEAVRIVDRNIKYYQAATSEMFGKVDRLPVTLTTPLHPLSPYAISKACDYWTVVNFRESYGMFTCNGVTFNHESYLRGKSFFVKKVITGALSIKSGDLDELTVGNLEARRDFGYAPLYVEAMWRVLQHEEPRDFIICSGKSVSLKDIVSHVFRSVGLSESRVRVDRNLYRPIDILDIYGDNTDAKKLLGWSYDLDFFTVLDMLIKEEQIALRNASAMS